MSGDEMARVVRDIRNNRLVNPRGPDDPATEAAIKSLAESTVLIDARAVYNDFMSRDEGNYVYEDHRVAPPWDNALLVWSNQYNNVMAVHAVSYDIQDEPEGATFEDLHFEMWQPEDADHEIEWDRVRWMISALVYSGGRHSSGVKVPTAGPLVWWQVPVYADGEIADFHWTLFAKSMEISNFDNAMMTFLGTYNLCNCVNVHVHERVGLPRHVRRRIQRNGVRFSEIHILPTSQSYRGTNGTPLSQMPVHGVRGHFATYGQDGRGLLFGKIAGRFWIPQHVRGSKAAGEVEQEYVAGE